MKSKFVSDRAAQTKNSTFLHSVQFAPEFGVIGEIVERQLRFIELSPERKYAELHIGGAQFARGPSVKPELDPVAPNELLSDFCQPRLGRFSGDAERPDVAGLVIDDPKRVIGKTV